MRSPVPILLAFTATAVAGIALFREKQDSPERTPHSSSASPGDLSGKENHATYPGAGTRTFSPEKQDLFAGILPSGEEGVDAETLRSLFQAKPGMAVSLPFGSGLTGTVILSRRHPRGDLATGIKLDDFDGADAFFTLSPDGRIGGHLFSTNSGSAWRIEPTGKDGRQVLRRIPADSLICARYERGRLLPGMPPEPEASAAGPGGDSVGYDSAPLLESRPGSPRVVYLNFDGETVSGTPWNSSYNAGAPIAAAPFSNPSLIPDIWASIAEDFAIYEVNVTTNRTAFENAAPQHRVMAIFTPTKSWYGSAGGVAYVGSFGNPTNPYCWVFNVTLSGAAESGSHEIGHTLGLRHDGTSSRVYYAGHAHASRVTWAPVMGTGYSRSIVQFSKGEYPDANRTEDDFDIMSGYLAFLPDDHGDSPGSATVLSPDGVFDLRGIIESSGDSDWFRFQSAAPGTFSASAAPPPRFRNLDAGIELLDESLEVVASSAPEGPFEASLELPNLPPGVYYLRVRGTGLGDLATGYSPYGSVGNYTLSGSYTAFPPPGTPGGLVAGDGSSTAGVALSWNEVDPSDGYRLYRGLLEDGSDAVLLASPSLPSHFDDGSVAGTVYYYFVTAVHLGRESARSGAESGWRQRLPPESPALVGVSDDSPHSIRVGWAPSERAQSYRIWRNPSNSFSGSVELGNTTLLSWYDTTTVSGEAWYYFVEAINSGGTSAPAAAPTAGVKVPLPPGTPTGLTASDGTSNLLTHLSWNAADGALGYRIFRNTAESPAGATEVTQVGPVTSHEDGTGEAGTVYWYFVKAILAGGDSVPSNLDQGSRKIQPPPPPADSSASLGTHPGGILVTWTATPDTDSYHVYRSADGNSLTAELLGETGSTSWLDEDAAPGRTYRYFIRGSNLAGISEFTPAALGYGPGNDPLDDLYENNDDISLPAVLDSGGIEAVCVDGDPDWYAVTLAPGDNRLDLLVPYETERGSIFVSLHEADGTPLASHSEAPGARVLSHVGGEGASYRILVERDDGAAVPYKLEWRSLSGNESGLFPDVKLGPRLPPEIGEELFSRNGAGQSMRLRLRPGDTRRVYGEVVNRSAVPGSFVIFGSRGRKPFQLEYDLQKGGNWKRVTAAVRRSGLVRELDPFSSASLRITVARGKGQSPGYSRLLRCLFARPRLEAGPLDAATLRLIAGPMGR